MTYIVAADQRTSGRGTVAGRQRNRRRTRPTLLALEERTLLSTFTVNNPTDAPIAGETDLRQAIGLANTAGGANTIDFDSSVFNMPQTITLAGTQLELSGGTETITGPAAGVTVSGGGTSRVFQVDGGVTASISGVTITGGDSAGYYGYGGGLENGGTTTLTNCTVSGNSAGLGGGVDTGSYANKRATTTLINCTVSGNSAQNGGGIYTDYFGGQTALTNTIVAGNTNPSESASDLGGRGAVSGNNNLVGAGGSGGLIDGVGGNIVGVADPGLAPLGSYGGSGQTMALLPGSPAIDAGTSGPNIPTTDERGLGRFGAVDIGAFESQGFALAVVPGSSPQTSNIGTAFANPLAVTVTANNPVEPVDGGVVSFVANPAANGASAIFLVPSAVIAGGQAAVTAAPDNVGGSYQVAASATGSSAVSFALTNTGVVYTGLIVNTTIDALAPGAGLLSLREAIGFANTDSSGNSTITFDSSVFNTPQTITLTGNQLELSNTTETETITGPAAGVTVDGGGNSRVFQIDANVTASISGLTISGGGAANGGGLANQGSATLTDCTVSGNSATYGGGLWNSGEVSMINCTVSGNSASSLDGGGLWSSGTAALINSTVSANSSGYFGAGLYSTSGVGNAALTNTIVAGNSGQNIDGNYSGTNNLIGGNPLLAPLGDYGGPMETMALLPGSPAIDAGISGAGIPATDQRGLGRVGAVDIGSFESQGFTLTTAAGSTPQTADIGTPFANPLAVTLAANNPIEPVDGGVLSFVANPVSGATAILSASSAVIANGQAAVTAVPYNVDGSYTVVASAIEGSTTFALTNTGPVFAALVVNTISDSLTPGAGLLSLREAIAFANIAPSGNSTITFDSTVFSTPETITLGGTELELSNPTGTETITGPTGGVTVSGGGASRVFQVDEGVTADFNGLAITGGSTAGTGGGVNVSNGTADLTDCTISGNTSGRNGGYGGYGGGLCDAGGNLTLSGCIVAGNIVGDGSGGGGLATLAGGTTTLTNCTVIDNSCVGLSAAGDGIIEYEENASTTMTDCTISGNFGGRNGGGLALYPGDTAVLTNCTISGNSTSASGGGMFLNGVGPVTLTNCTISDNTAGVDGGGLRGLGRNTLNDCTISGNTAGVDGGGLFLLILNTLNDCTISGNSAPQGGGLQLGAFGNTLNNTIVAGNLAGGDISGSYSGSNDLVGGNPLLAPLGSYGGPTETMPLLPGSPAIDAGSNVLVPAGVTTDQRGMPRIVNGTVDIGAFESSGFTIAADSGSGQSAGVLTAFPAPLVVTVTAINAMEPVAGGVVTIVPQSGAATLAASATINAGGSASIATTANGIAGGYTISASASGITTPASFSLTNVPLIIALDPSAAGAFSVRGNGRVNTPGLVYVDSSSSSALSASGNARVKAAAIDVVGGVQTKGNARLSPAPVTGSPALSVASLPLPSTTGMTNYGPVSLSGNSIETIQPGIYSQISLTGNARLKMSPGIYVIEGGGFSASGNATVTGSRVMIVNAGTNYPGTGGTYGSITIGGNARVNLSPATIGTDAGIVFFQPPDNTEVLTLTGNSSGITGTIYAPTAPFSERGNAAINASLIVDTIAISSNGVADVKTAGGGSPGGVIPNPSGASTGLMALNFVLADAGIVSVVNPIAASRTVMQTAAKRSAPNVVTTSRPTAIDPAAVDALLIDGLSVRSRRIADRPGEPLKWSL